MIKLDFNVMLVSCKIMTIFIVIICKFFIRISAQHQGGPPSTVHTTKYLHDSVIADTRIKDSVIRASSSSFGWYGSTRTIFMNKIGGVPRWVML